MPIAVNKLSALAILRNVRTRGIDVNCLLRIDLPAPRLPDGRKWTLRRLDFSRYGLAPRFSDAAQLSVAVPSAGLRLRSAAVSNTVYGEALPARAFMLLDEELAIPTPELLFVELAGVLNPVAHLLVGFELCGCYVPEGAYRLKPATTVEKIRAFVDGAPNLHGIKRARKTLRYLADNAWSPMEAVLAAFIVLPAVSMGFGFGRVTFNRRIQLEVASTESRTRVPDIVIDGTRVGFNYEGDGHLDLRRVADASQRAALEPGDASASRELALALSEVRGKYVDDRRRDRDLLASGQAVFAVVKEDLLEAGALERLMQQVLAILEKDGVELAPMTGKLIGNPIWAKLRQNYIWALMPGRVGAQARESLARSFAVPEFAIDETWLLESDDEGWVEKTHISDDRSDKSQEDG